MLVPLAAAAVLAACGGTSGDRLARADSAPLIALSNRIAREPPCGQVRDLRLLRAAANRLVNKRRVPASLLEPMLSGVADLESRRPVCIPPAPAAAPAPTGAAGRDGGRGSSHGRGRGKGRGGEGGD